MRGRRASVRRVQARDMAARSTILGNRPQVFGEMGSGKTEELRRTPSGQAPFIILYLYRPNELGLPGSAEDAASGKAEAPPYL